MRGIYWGKPWSCKQFLSALSKIFPHLYLRRTSEQSVICLAPCWVKLKKCSLLHWAGCGCCRMVPGARPCCCWGSIDAALPGTAAILGSRGSKRLKSVKKGSSYLILIAHAAWKFNDVLMAVFCAVNVVKWPVREVVSISPYINLTVIMCASIDVFSCVSLRESWQKSHWAAWLDSTVVTEVTAIKKTLHLISLFIKSQK